MEEKKYHFEEHEGEEMDDEFNADSYPLGRSLEQVKAHCAEINRYLDDPNYGTPVAVLNAKIEKMIAEYKR